MNIFRISRSISDVYQNWISDSEISAINHKLSRVHGLTDVAKVLKSHDLVIGNKQGVKYSLMWKLLAPGSILRNAYLVFRDGDGKGYVVKKKNPLPHDESYVNKRLGPFTEEIND